jgi:hypothetical protein
MGHFSELVEKFREAQEKIRDLGTQIVEAYPNSPRLIEMSTEIDSAVTALDILATSLEDALQAAEQDDGLFKSLMEQIDQTEIYESIKPSEKKKIVEHLVQNKQRLADQEALMAYVEKSLSQKSSSDLIAMYPKAKILERGRAMDTENAEGFDAYKNGLAAYQKDFDADKATAVKELAKVWLSRGMDSIIREFYAGALQADQPVKSEPKIRDEKKEDEDKEEKD